jgi:hypothetical protein
LLPSKIDYTLVAHLDKNNYLLLKIIPNNWIY